MEANTPFADVEVIVAVAVNGVVVVVGAVVCGVPELRQTKVAFVTVGGLTRSREQQRTPLPHRSVDARPKMQDG